MGHYKANLRDLEFNLFEVFGRQEVLGREPFAEIDADTARHVLSEVARLAEGELAESFAEGDRTPPVFDSRQASVALPEGVRRSFRTFYDSEWWRLDIPQELGGTLAPPSLHWAAAELVLGANPAVYMYSSGPNFAHVIWRLGTSTQRKIAQRMVERAWAATMMLTEPDAGSDVGSGRARAIPQSDGTWHVEGVKRFITGGEHDLADNIVHFVLARPEGAGPGTKGLSLFLVPKYLFDWDTGELGERNGVSATNLEHKMGLKVTATCEMRFGERQPAVGYLLGDAHNGIAQMFTVIEYARMLVGTKAIATLSTGYLNAREYARTRVQGPDLTRGNDKTAPRVTITHHPDVRRMLMTQKAYVEGMRALVLYTATFQDQAWRAQLTGGRDERAERRNDVLLPIVKGFGSERSYELLALSLQVLGGSGYLQDYPIEQYIRDAKIDTLYEGTTGIQGNDLFFRKIVKDNGQALTQLFEEMREFAKGDVGNGALTGERERLAAAVEDVQGIVTAMVGQIMSAVEEVTNIYKVGQNTTRLLMAMGDLVTGWMLLRQAEVALARLGDGTPLRDSDRAFYEGKVAVARFFAREILPTLAPQRMIAESTDNAIMDLSEDAF